MFKMKRLPVLSVLLLTILVGACVSSGSEEKEIDATTIKEWINLASKGDPDSQVALGILYFEGIVVPKDDKLALKWYKRAAEQGFYPATLSLFEFYSTGTQKDIIRAYMWQQINKIQMEKILVENESPSTDYTANRIRASLIDTQKTLEREMSQAQIEAAQKLAREWLAKHKK